MLIYFLVYKEQLTIKCIYMSPQGRKLIVLAYWYVNVLQIID